MSKENQTYPTTAPLTYPAPNRCSVSQPGGKYSTKKWDADDMALARQAGAYFIPGKHDMVVG